MRLQDHFIREGPIRQRPYPQGPLRSLVLQQVPANKLVTLEDVREGVRDYIDRHPLERREILENVPREQMLNQVEQLLIELELDLFVRRIPGRELEMFLSR